MSGLFHFAHLQGPFVLWNVSKFPSFLRLNIISLHVYTTFRLSIHLSRDILVVSTFRLLWIMLLQKWSYKYLFNSLLSILLGIYPKMELLEDIEILCLFFEGPAIQWLHHFTFPSALCFSTSSTHLSFFHYRHPSGFIFKKLFIWPCCVFAAFVCIFSSCSE